MKWNAASRRRLRLAHAPSVKKNLFTFVLYVARRPYRPIIRVRKTFEKRIGKFRIAYACIHIIRRYEDEFSYTYDEFGRRKPISYLRAYFRGVSAREWRRRGSDRASFVRSLRPCFIASRLYFLVFSYMGVRSLRNGDDPMPIIMKTSLRVHERRRYTYTVLYELIYTHCEILIQCIYT